MRTTYAAYAPRAEEQSTAPTSFGYTGEGGNQGILLKRR
jgi:hypothetical protein